MASVACLDRFTQSSSRRHDAVKPRQRRGYSCLENPDEFGVDLLVEGKGKKFGCEVEVKTKWFGAEFTFPTLISLLESANSWMRRAPVHHIQS